MANNRYTSSHKISNSLNIINKLQYSTVGLTSRNTQIVFNSYTLVVEHDAATAVSIKEPLHQLHLRSKRHVVLTTKETTD